MTDEPTPKRLATEDALHDLREAFEKRTLADSPEIIEPQTDAPESRFGMVYYGPVPHFAEGKPHYAMVSELLTNPMRRLRMAPITSKKRSGKKIMTLPPGTLPPKKKGNQKREITSYVILSWRARYSMGHVQERMKYHKRLPDEKIEEARKILQQL